MDEMRSKLFYEQKNGYDLIGTEERIAVEEYSRDYMEYLNISRTEREAVNNAIAIAMDRGFSEYRPGMALKPGMKIFSNNRGKALMLAVIGKKPLSEGAVIAGAHVDAPRLDLKQVTMYESDEMCYFKTHYYGGIKKYQWVTIPLELHGVVALKSGEVVEVSIGRDPEEPKFVITDLLPHLAQDQMKKTMAEGFTGEGLNILIGSTPYADEGKDRVKLAVLSTLNDMYGITEEDFLSADLSAVPAIRARDVGLDRSLIGAYGHDDRVCAYPSLTALFATDDSLHTSMVILADKEEIGSEGNTGMQCDLMTDLLAEIAAARNGNFAAMKANSKCLSSDVTACFDPNFADVFDRRNVSLINCGVAMSKYTGHGGKVGTNDAPAEYVAWIRRIMADAGVIWQAGDMGKDDVGGGGTVAKYIAKHNIETVDLGVPVISMHAPYEIISKADLYTAHQAFEAFFRA